MKRKVLMAEPHPSGASRWIPCPGSLQASYGRGETATANVHALDGTTAHRMLEICSRYGHDPMLMTGKIDPETKRERTVEMADSVQLTLNWINDWCQQRPGTLIDQERVVTIKLGPYTLSGTLDHSMYAPKSRELVTLDYKNGWNWVSAEDNYQIALYTIGNLLNYPDAKTMTGIIAQPRAVREEGPLIREWPITFKKLKRIESQAIEALHIAHQPNAPRTAGTHCKWCPAAGDCRTLAEYNFRNAVSDFTDIRTRPVIEPDDPQTMSADGLAWVLSQRWIMEAWLRACEAEGVRRLMRQEAVPGWKMTSGRKFRVWKNEKRVVAMLKAILAEEDIYTVPTLRSPHQIERLVRDHPKIAARVAALIVSRPGAPHIAPENDPRPALTGTASLDFQPIPKKGK